MNCLCSRRKITITGRIIITAEALVSPQSRLKRVAKLRVAGDDREQALVGQEHRGDQEFIPGRQGYHQSHRQEPGQERGTTTRQNTGHSLAPSTLAASSKSVGSWSI